MTSCEKTTPPVDFFLRLPFDSYPLLILSVLIIYCVFLFLPPGSYEEYPARYKHVYFNYTRNTLLIYTLLVTAVTLTYEVTKNLVKLIARQHARMSMVILLATSIYPHYYTFWSYFNAYNDDFYDQFWHQALFSSTEILSSFCVYRMCSKKRTLSHGKLLIVATIGAFHIVASAMDQFVYNVVRVGGEWHQFSRDLSFMAVDVLHLVISSCHLVKGSREFMNSAQLRSYAFYSMVIFCFLVAVCRIL